MDHRLVPFCSNEIDGVFLSKFSMVAVFHSEWFRVIVSTDSN